MFVSAVKTRSPGCSLRVLAAFLFAGLAVSALGAYTAGAAERPLVYVVVIDGMDGDRVDAGRAPFISSLLRGDSARATYYRESRSVIVSETNPNHVAMMTGAYGGGSGVIANAYALYAPLENEDSCKATGPVDSSKRPTETTGENANCLLAQTVFEAIGRQGNPDELVTAAVFGKPKLGRLFAGKRVNLARRDVDYLWAPCSAGPEDDDYCESIPTNPATGYALDDATVMDRVLRTVTDGVVTGDRTRRPDLTFVNLHQTDSAGHGFGTDTGPYDSAIALADRELERLVTLLRRRGEWARTVLVLLSDHSMDNTPQRTSLQSAFTDAGIDTARFVVIDNGSVDFVYLTDRTSPARFALLKQLRQAALAQRGVAEALYREQNPADGGRANTLAAVHPTWNLESERTPDLFVTSKPGYAFTDPSITANPLLGNHGAPQTRDNFLAVIGGGEFVLDQALAGTASSLFEDTLANPGQPENVDVASTVMGIFGLFAPRDNAGRFLQESFDIGKLPGGGAPSAKPMLKVRRLRRAGGAERPVSRRGRRTRTYRLSWVPKGGIYDLQLRSGKRRRTLLNGSTRTSYDLTARATQRYEIRVRMRAASGVASGWTQRTVGTKQARAPRKVKHGSFG